MLSILPVVLHFYESMGISLLKPRKAVQNLTDRIPHRQGWHQGMDTTQIYEVHKVIPSNLGDHSFSDDRYILQLLLILSQCPRQLQRMKTALVIKMYSFYVNTLCCIYYKVTTLTATDCHLAFDLSEIFMVATYVES